MVQPLLRIAGSLQFTQNVILTFLQLLPFFFELSCQQQKCFFIDDTVYLIFICLVFKNEIGTGITLTGMKPDGSPESKHFSFHQVRYGELPIRVDFFLSLGWLWGDERGHWLIHDEEKSQKLVEMFADQEKWRATFTRNNTSRYLIKSSAWAQEQEYRIVLDDLWVNHSKTENRYYHYDFNDLDGIVFGMRTPLAEKLQIINIVNKKCLENKRDTFNFYQAFFDTNTSRIEIEPITLFK